MLTRLRAPTTGFGAAGRFAGVPRLRELVTALQEWFDPRWAESWDAVGLVCGDPSADVSRAVLAVDAVPDTVAEAVDCDAQLLITHHPLLLTGVHGVPTDDPKGALVHGMIRAGVAHFVAHTNADNAAPGVSDALADRLGLRHVRPLATQYDEPQDAVAAGRRGTGRVGELAQMTTLGEFAANAAAALPATSWGLRVAGDPNRTVRTVAVCGGSGGSFAELARSTGADVFLTADLKHHPALEAVTERGARGMALIDAAHWATEAPWLDALATALTTRFGTTVDVRVSRQVTDPWTLHVPSAAAP